MITNPATWQQNIIQILVTFLIAQSPIFAVVIGQGAIDGAASLANEKAHLLNTAAMLEVWIILNLRWLRAV